MITVLAGRRVDPSNATTARFPLQNVGKVQEDLGKFFLENDVAFLISSGACGADLIALEVAGELGIERKMVLPFDPTTFRSSSVVDRPGDWGKIFDAVYSELKSHSDVVQLNYNKEDDDVYEKTNFDILDTADLVAEKLNDKQKVAIVIWEGSSKSEGDTTDHFRREAEKRGYMIKEIITLF